MSVAAVVVLLSVVFGASATLTGLLRRYALRAALLDIPNERSSHTVPTPRGGGLAVVLALFGASAWLWSAGVLEGRTATAIMGGGVPIALIGWVDDHRAVSALARLVLQVLAAVWAEWLLLGFGTTPTAWLSAAAAVLALVWLTNLYNFMDGIDGLAGAEAVTAATGGALLLWLAGDYGLAAVAAALAAAAAGFLLWNWPPARIFMGDVGSGTLGYAFGVLALASGRSGSVPVLTWAVLLAVFIFDATYTLIRRIVVREQWYSAHCSHAYQRAVQVYASHRIVTVAAITLNILLLWPLAFLSAKLPSLGSWILLSLVCFTYLLWRYIQRRWNGYHERTSPS